MLIYDCFTRLNEFFHCFSMSGLGRHTCILNTSRLQIIMIIMIIIIVIDRCRPKLHNNSNICVVNHSLTSIRWFWTFCTQFWVSVLDKVSALLRPVAFVSHWVQWRAAVLYRSATVVCVVLLFMALLHIPAALWRQDRVGTSSAGHLGFCLWTSIN